MYEGIISLDEKLRDSIFNIMVNKSLTVSVAESCTGGILSAFFTSGSGASNFFRGGLVAYSNQSKIDLLNIDPILLEECGVVSKSVVEQMAQSVRKKYNTDYGLATTGYVELSNSMLKEPKTHLHAWISISHSKQIISKYLTLSKNRTDNMTDVAHLLLNQFRKEII